MAAKDNFYKNVFSEFIQLLDNKSNFSFVRYGDGEWSLIMKKDPPLTHITNLWGPEILSMGDWLGGSIKDAPRADNYYVGMQPLAVHLWREDIERELPEDLNVCNADTLHNSSIDNTLPYLINSLVARNLIVVGPEYLKNLSILKDFQHVVTPEKYAWNHIPHITSEVIKAADSTEEPVILYSASLASKIMIHSLYLRDVENRITQIDTGSLLDPYAGVNSRSYHPIVLERIKNEQ
jgi:hypothetical protein